MILLPKRTLEWMLKVISPLTLFNKSKLRNGTKTFLETKFFSSFSSICYPENCVLFFNRSVIVTCNHNYTFLVNTRFLRFSLNELPAIIHQIGNISPNRQSLTKPAFIHQTSNFSSNRQSLTKSAFIHQTSNHSPNQQSFTKPAITHQTSNHSPNQQSFTKQTITHQTSIHSSNQQSFSNRQSLTKPAITHQTSNLSPNRQSLTKLALIHRWARK